MSDVVRRPPEKPEGFVYKLNLTKAASGAAYHALVNTKVKKSTRKNHSRVMKALKRSSEEYTSCLYEPATEDERARFGDWMFREGILVIKTNAYDHLKSICDKLLEGEGVEGRFGEGYDDLYDTLEEAEKVRREEDKAAADSNSE